MRPDVHLQPVVLAEAFLAVGAMIGPLACEGRKASRQKSEPEPWAPAARDPAPRPPCHGGPVPPAGRDRAGSASSSQTPATRGQQAGCVLLSALDPNETSRFREFVMKLSCASVRPVPALLTARGSGRLPRRRCRLSQGNTSQSLSQGRPLLNGAGRSYARRQAATLSDETTSHLEAIWETGRSVKQAGAHTHIACNTAEK